jgi:hypothetical protein
LKISLGIPLINGVKRKAQIFVLNLVIAVNIESYCEIIEVDPSV